jgi:phosphatidylserine/phosphatidylglycerophosphate/cardiolipin synthase-like enzyme
MRVQLRSASIRLFVLSCLIGSGAAFARGPDAGLYENSTATPLIALLDSAQKMIDIEIYAMGDPLAQKAVLNALSDGVKVRILQEPKPVGSACRIFENHQVKDDAACTEIKAFRAKVLRMGGTYLPFNKKLCGGATSGCVEHGKMVLVDAKAALLSTGNFDSTSLCNRSANPKNCDRDYSYIIRYAPTIQVLGEIFEKDLKGTPYNLQSILARAGAADLTVSPYSLAPLVDFIDSARSSIVIQEQYLKDPKMNAALLEAAKAGVAVKINVESACFFGTPSKSEVSKWKATYGAFEDAGAQIRVFTRHVRVGGLDGYLHAKAIVVDGKTAWVGSVNGSTQALGSNREFGVFFDAPRDVSTMLGFMMDDFRNPAGETWRDSLKCKHDF